MWCFQGGSLMSVATQQRNSDAPGITVYYWADTGMCTGSITTTGNDGLPNCALRKNKALYSSVFLWCSVIVCDNATAATVQFIALPGCSCLICTNLLVGLFAVLHLLAYKWYRTSSYRSRLWFFWIRLHAVPQNSMSHIVPSEQERTRCILDETEKIEKQSLRDA